MKTSKEGKNPLKKGHSFEVGEWFLLSQIGRNSNPYYFRELMENVVKAKNVEQDSKETRKKRATNERVNKKEVNEPGQDTLNQDDVKIQITSNKPNGLNHSKRQNDDTMIPLDEITTNNESTAVDPDARQVVVHQNNN